MMNCSVMMGIRLFSDDKGVNRLPFTVYRLPCPVYRRVDPVGNTF
jgi:hypothetical protein